MQRLYTAVFGKNIVTQDGCGAYNWIVVTKPNAINWEKPKAR